MKIYKKNGGDVTILPNEHYRHQLSLKALGLFSYIWSKPDGWNFSARGTATQVKDSKEGVQTAIRELEIRGFLIREQKKKQTGKFGSAIWTISGTPEAVTLSEVAEFTPDDSDFVDKMAGKPETEKPETEKTVQVITNKVITKGGEQFGRKPASPPTTFFGEVGKDKRFKRLPMIDQMEVLKLTMGIHERVDFDSMLERIKKSSGRKDILQTAYQWFYRDCLEGKLATNYYLEGFRDDLPKNFEEAEYRMDRQLFLPQYTVELINQEVVHTPGIQKTNSARLDELKEKLLKLESVETKSHEL